ncbi:MAG: 16S rRNA processing protein RimM, partial [Oscillospiraceae bacterium]|nr:16S rRNA processing protein RimM [Oscillospiraceae bacterium]
MKRMQEVGRVVNTHGLRGEVKLDCWCDSPGFIGLFSEIVIGGKPYTVTGFREHKHMALVTLEGIDG